MMLGNILQAAKCLIDLLQSDQVQQCLDGLGKEAARIKVE